MLKELGLPYLAGESRARRHGRGAPMAAAAVRRLQAEA